MIRVLLVEDRGIVRRAIAQVVHSEPDLEVVGEAGTFRDAVGQINATVPDVAVLDVRLPDGDGVDLCRAVRSVHPSVKCLFLTAYDDDTALRSSILAGASGYVLKDVRGRGLVDAIRRAAAGEDIQPADVRRQGATAMHNDQRCAAFPTLSLHEGQVLNLIIEGMTDHEIGVRLGLAEKTVKYYVIGLLAALGMERGTQPAVYDARRKQDHF